MSANNREEIEKLLGSIQFDRWIFGYPTRFTLASHCHTDHNPLESSFDFPEPLVHSRNYTPKKTVNALMLNDGDREKIGGTYVSALGPKTITRLTGLTVPHLHSCWWIISTKRLLILFVGELDAPETPVLSKLLDNIPNLDAVLLPSYGGINPPAHNSTHRDQLKNEIASLAVKEKEKGHLVYALPHPVLPDWAGLCARRV